LVTNGGASLMQDGQFRWSQKFLEVGVERHEVFVGLDDGRRKPRIEYGVGGQFPGFAQLAQNRPLAAEGWHVDIRHRKQGVDESNGVVDWCGLDEDSRIGHQSQEACASHGHELQARATRGCT
jgi:hypothetical protein